MQEENTAVIKGPGERLKSAREALGFTPWDIANQLYLAEKVILALEEDDYETGPGPAFARGYLRSYAKLLRLSPEEIIQSFESLGVHKLPQEEVPKTLKPPHAMIAKHRDKVWFGIIGGSIVFIAILIVSMFWLDKSQEEALDPMQLKAHLDKNGEIKEVAKQENVQENTTTIPAQVLSQEQGDAQPVADVNPL